MSDERIQVNVRLSQDLMDRVNQARGLTSQSDWFAHAAELALKPTAAYQDKELYQPYPQDRECLHGDLRPSRTEIRDDVIVRYYLCSICEEEVLL